MNTDTYGMMCSWLGMVAGAVIAHWPSIFTAVLLSIGVSLICAGLSRYAVRR